MTKLTKEQYDAQQEAKQMGSGNVSGAHRRRQIAIAKGVYDWQTKEGIFAWDAEELETNTGITLVPGPFILEQDGVAVQFVREATPDGEDDMRENEGRFGNYILTRVDEGLYNIERK